MKKTLLIALPLLLILGYSQSVNESTLIKKGKPSLRYLPDSDNPYNGEAHTNILGEKMFMGTYNSGLRDGLWTGWYDTGKKQFEETFKVGKQDGLKTKWDENGQKFEEGNYKDGGKDGIWTRWSSYSGEKINEKTYRNGELIDEKCWDFDGGECECDADIGRCK